VVELERERVADILMEDDELEVVRELTPEVERAGKRGEKSRSVHTAVVFEVGPDLKIRVIDLAIVVVTILLVYLIIKNI